MALHPCDRTHAQVGMDGGRKIRVKVLTSSNFNSGLL